MIAEQWRNAYATQNNETANGILQYKTPMISARKSDGNGMADKRGFRQAG